MTIRRFDKQFEPYVETRYTATKPGRCEECQMHVRFLYRLTSTGKTYCGNHIDGAVIAAAERQKKGVR